MTFAIDPGPLDRALEDACVRLEQSRFADALWSRRPEVWTSDPVVRGKIADRLGWLDAMDRVRPHVARVRRFAQDVKGVGFSDVVLLGMGGSSLATEVVRAVVGTAAGCPRFQVLDSVDPDAVRGAMARPRTSLFIVASKSGTTIEVSTLAAEAERRVRAAGATEPGAHFVAITDENTPLHRGAVERRFRDVFLNPADVGGRFSALTLFGLVPAALMGIDVDALLSSAEAMAKACRDDDPRRNPGLALGAMLAAAATHGRDKLTLVLPDRLRRLGLWIEQLVAESTGKQGKGILPVAGEPRDAFLGADRILVAVNPGASGVAGPAPLVTLEMPDVSALGAEFFRWEVATATAGFLLGINPFDEPDVQQAKDVTRELLARYSSERRLPIGEPDAVVEGVRITLTAPARAALAGGNPLAILSAVRPGDYVALLAYVPPEDERFAPVLESLRSGVTARTGCAATVGYGPRYLHSTGQLHKGGPNTGVFVIVTAEASDDLPVPEAPYSFGILEMAQAVGDFRALERAGRRAAHVHLPSRQPALLQRLTSRLAGSA